MTVYHRQEDEDAAREAYERGDPKHPDSGPVGETRKWPPCPRGVLEHAFEPCTCKPALGGEEEPWHGSP